MHPIHTAFPPAPARALSLVLRGAVLAACGLAPLAFPATAHAQSTAPQAVSYHIPAGPLPQALNAFGRQSGILLSYASSLAAGRQSPGLQGVFSVEEALRRLLAGTGLEAVAGGNGVYTLRETAEVAELAPLTVTGQQNEPFGPVQGYVATRSASTKSALSLAETPRSVNVVTRDQMDAQGVRNLDQALSYTPGVVVEGNGIETRSDNLSVRGFVPVSYRDGLQDNWVKIETYGLERVEVVKGPASMLYGQGAPGGVVNMVSKRPTAQPFREVAVETGNHDRKQGALDLSGPIDEDAVWRYRLVGLWRDTGTQVDHVDERRAYLAPSLSWTPSADTQVTLFARYQRDRSGMSFSALPVAGTLESNPWGKLPPSRFTGDPNFNDFRADQHAAGYEITHAFAQDWRVVQNLSFSKTEHEFRALFGDGIGSLLPDMRTYQRDIVHQDDWARGVSVDTRIVGKAFTGPAEHNLTFGVDWKRLRSGYTYRGVYYGTPGEAPPIDLYDPVYGVTVPEPPAMSDSSSTLRQLGLYAQDEIRLGRWVFSLGGRYDRADTIYDFTNHYWGTATQSDHRDHAFTWQAGALYRFGNGLSPYLSYATSFQPVNGGSFDGEPFEPTKGKQWEAGIKFQPEGYDSFATLSLFELRQENVLTPDLANPGFNTQSGRARIRGVELEAKASLDNGLALIASYTYQDAKVTHSNRAGEAGKPLSNVPRHQASAWLDYTAQHGPLAGLSAGIGVRYVGTLYGESGGNFRIPSYTLVDAALRYDLGRLNGQLRGLSFALNVNNLANKEYVRICGTRFACQYGTTRTVIASLGYRW